MPKKCIFLENIGGEGRFFLWNRCIRENGVLQLSVTQKIM